MTEEELKRKIRVRGGHRASAKRIIAAAEESLQVFDPNNPEAVIKVKQQLTTLKEKMKTLSVHDEELLSLVKEEEIENEIEQADIFKERLQHSIVSIEMALEKIVNETLAHGSTVSGTSPSSSNLIVMLSPTQTKLGSGKPIFNQGEQKVLELHERKISWDEPLDVTSKSAWFKLVGELEKVEQMVFPRYFVVGVEEEVLSYSLHGFCDASVKAYAAVIYLKMETLHGVYVRPIQALIPLEINDAENEDAERENPSKKKDDPEETVETLKPRRKAAVAADELRKQWLQQLS
ncbi:Hypothetical predicted protein [Paramuricea clavata]|uniref:Uncharacterized protein n=1 Tax=Paramuricea clavata TaxID=317549 RepID=A0A6S7GS09_PARCT|nr:Hypothetical predicted protein [Paramuricea clavata]